METVANRFRQRVGGAPHRLNKWEEIQASRAAIATEGTELAHAHGSLRAALIEIAKHVAFFALLLLSMVFILASGGCGGAPGAGAGAAVSLPPTPGGGGTIFIPIEITGGQAIELRYAVEGDPGSGLTLFTDLIPDEHWGQLVHVPNNSTLFIDFYVLKTWGLSCIRDFSFTADNIADLDLLSIDTNSAYPDWDWVRFSAKAVLGGTSTHYFNPECQ